MIFRWSETVKHLSKWGQEFSSKEDAIRSLTKEDGITVAGAALVAMLEMVQSVVNALGKNADAEAEAECEKKPANAKKFPTAKVGTFLYAYDCEEGLTRHIVVAVHEDHMVRVACCDMEIYTWARVHWGCDYLYESKEEAMRVQATSDIEWHEPRAKWAATLLRQLDEGGDISGFEAGFDAQEDDEAGEDE